MLINYFNICSAREFPQWKCTITALDKGKLYFITFLWEVSHAYAMKFNPDTHYRKSIRLKEYNYSLAS